MLPPAAHNAQTDAPEALPATGVPATSPPRAGDTVGQDVGCTRCGYNLRGLATWGLCPECGADVLPSVRARQKWAAPLPRPDGRWAAHIAEGSALSLFSFVLLIVMCVAPGQALYLPRRDAPLVDTPGRVVLLCVACAAWVTSWYSVWKLSAPAPAVDTLAPRRRARLARWAATTYFLLPFVVGLTPGYEKYPPPFPEILLLFAIPIAGAALFGLIAGLFRRAGGGWERLEAVLLAVLVPAALSFAALPPMRSRSTRVASLDLLYFLPLFPYGPPEFGRWLMLEMTRFGPDGVLLGLAAAAVWAAVLHLLLMLRYLPYARTGTAHGPRESV